LVTKRARTCLSAIVCEFGIVFVCVVG
jgi:hypothetical protein